MNLNAFESRFFSTCSSRCASVRNRRRHGRIDVDVEADALPFGDVAEGAFHALAQLVEAQLADIERHRARFDLREIENVVDQPQQVLA